MPTWGWFVVALVLADAAVLAAWFLARKKPRNNGGSIDRTIAGLDSASRDDIDRLVRENKNIQAIKLFRDKTGAGLLDSKNAIDAVQAGGALPSSSSDFASSRGWEDMVPRLRSLKAEGNTIGAIKMLRTRTGLSLREAKEAVDRL